MPDELRPRLQKPSKIECFLSENYDHDKLLIRFAEPLDGNQTEAMRHLYGNHLRFMNDSKDSRLWHVTPMKGFLYSNLNELDGLIKPNIQIRWLIRRDMDDVLRIENACYDFPWGEEDFLYALRQRTITGMVAEYIEGEYPKIKSTTVGFMVYEWDDKKMHLLNFAVDPEWRQCGIGTEMMEKMFDKLPEQQRYEITLEVRESNVKAQLFFKKMGFEAISVIKNHYDDTGESAYVLRYRLPEVEIPPPAPAEKNPVPGPESELLIDFDEDGDVTDFGSKTFAFSSLSPSDGGDNFSMPFPAPRMEDEPTVPRMSNKQLLTEMTRHLTDLTGAEWEVVRPDLATGEMATFDLAKNSKLEHVYFRTCGPVDDPQAADKAMREFFHSGEKNLFAAKPDKPAQVYVPASWAREVHLTSGEIGQYEPVFNKSMFPPDMPEAKPEDGKSSALYGHIRVDIEQQQAAEGQNLYKFTIIDVTDDMNRRPSILSLPSPSSLPSIITALNQASSEEAPKNSLQMVHLIAEALRRVSTPEI